MENKLQKKLAAYSALSGAFLLAGSQNAEAQIVYVDLPDDPSIEVNSSLSLITIGTSTSSNNASSRGFINLDLDGQAINTASTVTSNADVALQVWAGAGQGYSYYSSPKAKPPGSFIYNGASVRGNVASFIGGSSAYSSVIANMPSGAIVDDNAPLAFWNSMGAIGYSSGNYSGPVKQPLNAWSSGNFVNGNPNDITGFLGVKFDIGGMDHFGWIRVRVEQAASNNLAPGQTVTSSSKITILDYAYNAAPGGAIAVGDIGAPIPTMGQWGLIVLNFLLLIFGVTAVKQGSRLSLQRKKA